MYKYKPQNQKRKSKKTEDTVAQKGRTDEKQSREEAERRGTLKERRSEEKE